MQSGGATEPANAPADQPKSDKPDASKQPTDPVDPKLTNSETRAAEGRHPVTVTSAPKPAAKTAKSKSKQKASKARGT